MISLLNLLNEIQISNSLGKLLSASQNYFEKGIETTEVVNYKNVILTLSLYNEEFEEDDGEEIYNDPDFSITIEGNKPRDQYSEEEIDKIKILVEELWKQFSTDKVLVGSDDKWEGFKYLAYRSDTTNPIFAQIYLDPKSYRQDINKIFNVINNYAR